MSELKPEVIEPDPAATSIPNDETVNKNGGDASAPTNKDEVMSDIKAEETEVASATEAGNKKPESGSPEKQRGGDRQNNRRQNDNWKGRGGRDQRDNFRKNNKFDAAAREVSDDPKLIRSQVEFYFGDSNLPTDKFLWESTDGANNKPVPVKTIHNFKRMQVFQPYSAVVAALKTSNSLVVEGEEGAETIKRKFAYDPTQRDPREPRTVYVKGFGEEKPTTQFDLEAFFGAHGTYNSVRLRRHNDGGADQGLFKGSVFVEFADEETAQKFLKLDPKPQWEGKDDLKIMSKSDYVAEKNQLIKDGKMQPNETKPRFYEGRIKNPRGRGGNRGGRGDRDPNDWKKRRDDDQKSGFRDNNRRDRDSRGRGGRGRGRGRDGGDKSRSNDRNEERETKESGNPAPTDSTAEESKKRAREDDGATEAAPAKKQDTKEVAAEATS